jgi:hypothetical protein
MGKTYKKYPSGKKSVSGHKQRVASGIKSRRYDGLDVKIGNDAFVLYNIAEAMISNGDSVEFVKNHMRAKYSVNTWEMKRWACLAK